MWEQNDLWKAYCEHYDVVQSATNEWTRKALQFLNLVCASVSEKSWAAADGVTFKQIDPKIRGHSFNQFHFRLSEYFDLGSPYRYVLIISFDPKPDSSTCYFWVSAACHVKSGKSVGPLRKMEMKIVRQFVEDEDHDAYIRPERTGSYRFRAIDAASDDLTVSNATSAVRETLMGLKKLNKLLLASRG